MNIAAPPHRASLDFSTIDLAALERMEVHRGAAPLAWGGGSLGGAVHLFSASGQRRPWIRFDSGSYGERLAEAGGTLGQRLEQLFQNFPVRGPSPRGQQLDDGDVISPPRFRPGQPLVQITSQAQGVPGFVKIARPA